jgi:membrane protein
VLRQLSAELLTGGGVNPILAPFATVLGLFFYFFLLSINYLITAAWAAVITSDREAS